MSRTAHFGKDARKHLIDGVKLVADAVGSTLGPAGKTVVIQQKDKNPKITKDGVSVAKEIQPADEKLKLGADLAISVAHKALNNAGDGTSTATVLANAIISEGARQIELNPNGINLTSLRKGIDVATNFVIDKLTNFSTPIVTDEQLVNIATISANSDEKLGKTVADAYKQVGKDGVVTVEDSKERDISLSLTEGMRFDKGWVSSYLVTDVEKQIAEYENAVVLLCDSKITSLEKLISIVEEPMRAGKPIVFIADGFDSQVIDSIVLNRFRTGCKMVAIDAPGFGDRKKEILRDLGVVLDARVGDDVMGVKFETMTSADLGFCEKIIVKKDETIIRGGRGSKEAINARVEEIKIALNNTDVKYDQDKLKERLGSLTTGMATIRVGGSSEEEISELKDRLDDALCATKCALEEGYLPGAANPLLLISENLPVSEDLSINLGINIVKNALKVPFMTILNNAGIEPNYIMQQILDKKDLNYGYNAKKLELTNLTDSGIIDPVKVVKQAVYAAASIAGLSLTTQCIITNDPPKESGVNINALLNPKM